MYYQLILEFIDMLNGLKIVFFFKIRNLYFFSFFLKKRWENQVSRNRRRPHIGLEEPPQKNNVDEEEEALKRDSL